ncbi:MAG: M20/M25/M40 family metallo-hydrolase [Pararhodobacter sp.]|nr:M20/M25/M40 family metallo-hydrolase [Pararhodobacter sp.]
MNTRRTLASHGALDRRALILGSVAAGVLADPGLARHIAPGGPGKPPATAPGDAAPRANPAVGALVAQVSQARLRGHVRDLSGFPTRWTQGPDFHRVESWVAEAFVRGGAAPGAVSRQAYAIPSGLARHNILVGNPRDPRGVILVGAHMDSTSERTAMSAPGANDNATGVAVVLEAHHLLSRRRLDREIVFVAFSGEEQDLLGSRACAALARRQGWPIELMLNLDMLGHHPADPRAPIVIEYDQGNAVAANDARARAFALLAARLAAQHATLAVTHTDIWDSDYMPFEAAGFPCIGLYDNGAESAQYHTTSDTADRVDFPRLEQAARIVVATLATVAGLRG